MLVEQAGTARTDYPDEYVGPSGDPGSLAEFDDERCGSELLAAFRPPAHH
jgi:hypothetical protein